MTGKRYIPEDVQSFITCIVAKGIGLDSTQQFYTGQVNFFVTVRLDQRTYQ